MMISYGSRSRHSRSLNLRPTRSAREYAGRAWRTSNGFSIWAAGWYGIALGPVHGGPDAEQVVLRDLSPCTGIDPARQLSGSYLTGPIAQQFWPQSAQDVLNLGVVAIAPTQEVPSETAVVPAQER